MACHLKIKANLEENRCKTAIESGGDIPNNISQLTTSDHGQEEKPNEQEVLKDPAANLPIIELSKDEATTDTPKSVSRSSKMIDSASMVAKSIKDFFIHVMLCEVIAKQLPICVFLALPTVILDLLIAHVFKPQQELHYSSEVNRTVHKLATFNVNGPWIPTDDRDGYIANYNTQAVSYNLAVLLCYGWTLMAIPFLSLPREDFRKITGWKMWTAWWALVLFIIGCNTLGAAKASEVDGHHNYAVVGDKISPVILTTIPFSIMAFIRGRQFGKDLGLAAGKAVYSLVWLTSLLYPLEVVYLHGGLTTMTDDRKELVLFLYRVAVWPWFWMFLLVPLARYAMFTWQDNELSLGFFTWMLATQAVSSRQLMFKMHSPTLFLILSLFDVACQLAFNFYVLDLPLLDTKILKCVWRKCLPPVEGKSEKHLRMARMLWFQAQSLIDLVCTFSAAFREYAFFDQRYVFGSMFRPSCDGTFHADNLFIKLAISVVLTIGADIFTSYRVFIRGYPLQEAFRTLTTKKKAWLAFAILNLATFLVAIQTSTPIPGRIGDCTDFEDGCTCKGIAIFYEICGCCSPDPAVRGLYEVCSREV